MNFIKSSDLRITILLLIPGTLWGFSFLLTEIIVQTIPPFTYATLRNLLTAIPVIMMLYARGGRLRSTWSEWRPYIFLALFGNAVPVVLTAWGQLYIDGGLTTILFSLTPLFTVLLAHYFSYNEHINGKKIFGVTLGLLGTLLLVGPSALYDVGVHLWGQLAVIGGAFSLAVSAIYVRLHFRKKAESALDSALETLGSQFLISIVFLLPLTLLIDQPWTLQPSQASVIAVFISSWAIRIGAMLTYYYLIDMVGASTASTTLYLTPINGVFWGALILSETVTWSAIVALVLILSGVMLVNKAAAKKADLAKTESPIAISKQSAVSSQQ